MTQSSGQEEPPASSPSSHYPVGSLSGLGRYKMHSQPFSPCTKGTENGSLKPQAPIQVPNSSMEGVCFPPPKDPGKISLLFWPGQPGDERLGDVNVASCPPLPQVLHSKPFPFPSCTASVRLQDEFNDFLLSLSFLPKLLSSFFFMTLHHPGIFSSTTPRRCSEK